MRKILFGFIAFLCYQQSFAQCTVASFAIPDTFCLSTPVTFQNTSTGTGLSYSWDFCAKDYRAAAPNSTFHNLGTFFKDFDLIKVQGQYYLLSEDTTSSSFIVASYGNNLLSTTPAVVTYPSFPKINCIDFVNTGDSLMGLGIYSPSNLFYLISFPNGISNQPVFTLLSSISSFNNPSSIKIVLLSNIYYAMVTNKSDNSITCLSFGNSLLNAPVVVYTYPITLANNLADFDVDLTCNSITGFCVSASNGNILKLDFTSGIANPPSTVSDLGTFGSTGNLSLKLVDEGTYNYLFFSDTSTNYLKSLTFSDHNYTTVPVLSNISNYFYHPGIIQSLADSSYNKLLVSDDIALSLFEQGYPNACTGTSFSTDTNPVISFTNPGWNSITLTVNDGDGYTSTVTDSIFIINGPTASFSYSSNTCFNLNDSIAFSDLSTATSSISTWSWDFDDGSFSSAQNPYHQFAAPGAYNVKLTIQAGCSKDTIIPVVIKETPVVALTYLTGCAGSDIPFTDQTNAGTATIQSWQWNFGDNTAANALQNPTHAYALGGNYTVQLTVQTTQGCSDSASLPITIKSTPVAAFGITNTCVGDIVQFLNQTTINDGTQITYLWDFGNAGATSVLESPTYGYPAAGNYTVTLIAYSTQSCNDTLVQPVVVSTPPTANFSFPANNCQNNSVQFTDNSAGSTISSWVWDFGDGDSAFIQNPAHIFTGSGSFNVTLVVSAGNNCTASISKTINITAGPIAQFTALPVCDGTATHFIDQSTVPLGSTITSWYYSYGDGNAISIQNPQYTYSAAGTYYATLEVISSDGCTDSVLQPVVVNEIPFANFLTQNLRCAGSDMFFIDLSTANNSIITNWHWSFSDGDSSIMQSPNHTFASAGLASATLVVTTDAGCSDDATQSFTVLAPPQFTYSYSGTCFGDTTRFTYTPLNGGNANFGWQWSFGDNVYAYIPNPIHHYTQSGTFPLYLIVTDSTGCSSTVSDSITIHGKPNASILSNGICQDSPVQFINQTLAAGANITGWNWNFGDNQSSTDSVPQHTYSTPAIYTTTLIVLAEGGCNDTATTVLNIKPRPNAAFTISPVTGAPNNLINFTNASNLAVQYLWEFGNGLPTAITQNASYSYADVGTYQVTLTATSLYGCVDTAIKFIDIIDPHIDLIMKSLSYSIDDNYLQLNALIANGGNVNATTYDLEVMVDGGISIIETGHDTIPYAGEKLYKLNSRFKVSKNNLPVLACVKILNVNKGSDGDLTNNEKCTSLTSGLQVSSINPNPVIDILNMAYSLPDDAEVNINIYDAAGRWVKELLSATEKAGLAQHSFNVYGLNGGVYYIRFAVGDEVQHIKFIKR